MTYSERKDYFYVCSLIEYTARRTKNKRRVIVQAPGEEGVRKQLHDAGVNHCLSFEDEISDFRTGLYCENPSYLEWSYRDGRLSE